MQPTALDIQRQGDLGGEKILTRFDEDSIEFIMSVLTDLYSDPELAVIREYSTNALDSHVEAGVSRPIEVTTPSSLSPYFKVKDYGIGMSLEDIRKTYSAYGASTKRESNAVVGMLGLGSKSAWTYTAQFNVIAVKDGIKATVSATRTETGRTMLEIVDTCSTDEPNGVEIIVPAKQVNTFHEKAMRFFRFWAPGTVLVNGQPPKRIEGEPVGDRMVVVDDLDKDYIVMGNVAYPLEGKIHGEGYYNRGYGIVCHVNIGEVAFTPNREALNYNPHTKAAIDSLRAEFARLLKKVIQDDIDQADNHGEAMTKYVAWVDRFGQTARDMTYNGTKIEIAWNLPSGYRVWRAHYSRRAMDNFVRQIDHSSLRDALNIVNFPSSEVSVYQRNKVRIWAEQEKIALPNKVFFFNEATLPGAPWTDEMETVDWATIKAVKNPGSVRRASGGLRFSVVDSPYGWRETDELDTELEILFFSPADYNKDNVNSVFRSMTEEIQVVLLNRNRWDKFQRDFPTAKHVLSWLKEQIAETEKALTESDKIRLGLTGYDRDNLRRLDETRIDDPEVVQFVKLAKMKDTDSPTLDAYKKACSNARSAVSLHIPTVTVETPLSNYPLLDLGYRMHEHNYIYLNAAYAAEQANISAESLDEESVA